MAYEMWLIVTNEYYFLVTPQLLHSLVLFQDSTDQ